MRKSSNHQCGGGRGGGPVDSRRALYIQGHHQCPDTDDLLFTGRVTASLADC